MNESTFASGNLSTQMPFYNETTEETGNQTAPVAIIYTLKGLNDAVAKIYVGAVYLFAILIIPGIIGNLHVLHIYVIKKPKNNTRVYVCFLAMIDLLTCTVAFPYNIVNNLLPYMFYSNIACKLFTWLNGFVTMCSALSLLIIAIERYRKICSPFKTQVTIKYAKLSCLVVLVASTILSTPILYLYGSTRIPTVHPAFYGHECYVRMELRDTNAPIIYNLGVLFICTLYDSCMIILYVLIGIHLWKQQLKMRKNKMKTVSAASKKPGEKPKLDIDVSTSNLDSEATADTVVPESASTQDNVEPSSSDKPNEKGKNSGINTGKEELGKNDNQDKKTADGKRKPPKKSTKDDKMEAIKRNTYMFFLITLCYTLSYIPYPIIRLYQIFNIDWYLNLSLEAKMVYNTALCCLFINNVVNCFIYMLCDRHYRQELKGFYAKLICRK